MELTIEIVRRWQKEMMKGNLRLVAPESLDVVEFALDLHAQLQQERVKSLMYQEALEAIVSGGDMAWQLNDENSYTLAMCRIANAALQALSAPQAQGGEAE